MSLLEGTNSPHFHNESIKTHSPLVKLSCGPGSEISFAPFNLNNNTHSRNNTNSLSNCASIQSIGPNQKLVLSGELFFDKQIIINTKGFEYGLRKKKDGHCYIGFSNSFDKNGKLLNDYIVALKGVNNAINDSKRLFEIVYDKNENLFVLNFLHKTLSLQRLITNEYEYYFEYFKNSTLIIGEFTLTVHPKKFNDKHTVEISVLFEGNVNTYSFIEYSMPITIGRKNCTIILKHDNISKVHAFIFYSIEKEKFYIKDNFSTNKTYLLLKEGDSFLIDNQCECKVEDTKFKINLIS